LPETVVLIAINGLIWLSRSCTQYQN
jgi:hypothetical protein